MGAVVRYTLEPRPLPEMFGRVLAEFIFKILGLLLDRFIRTASARFLTVKALPEQPEPPDQVVAVMDDTSGTNTLAVDGPHEPLQDVQLTGIDGDETSILADETKDASQSTTKFVTQKSFQTRAEAEATQSTPEPLRETFIVVALVKMLFITMVAGVSMIFCHISYLVVSDRVPLFYGGTGHL
jgi:hypothetical protein